MALKKPTAPGFSSSPSRIMNHIASLPFSLFSLSLFDLSYGLSFFSHASPLRHGTFAVIITWEIWHHIKDKEAAQSGY